MRSGSALSGTTACGTMAGVMVRPFGLALLITAYDTAWLHSKYLMRLTSRLSQEYLDLRACLGPNRPGGPCVRHW